jgi:hypothetical protein
MICHHKHGYRRGHCHCGMFYQYCPVCESSMIYCSNCQHHQRFKSHATIRRVPYYKLHRDDVCQKRRDRYHRSKATHAQETV